MVDVSKVKNDCHLGGSPISLVSRRMKGEKQV